MKTFFLISLLMCGMAATAQSEVQTTSFNASILTAINSSKIHVVVNKEFGKKFSICLRDFKRNILYSSTMEKRSTQRNFSLNLSELPDGKYYLELSDNKAPVATKIIFKEKSILAKPIVSNQIVLLN